MKMKRMLLITACLMVMILAVSMICVGCKKDKDTTPEWNPSAGDNQTANGTEGTGSAAGNPTHATNSEGEIVPGGSLDLIDREELPTTPEEDPQATTNPTTPTMDPNAPQLDADGYWTYEYYITRTGEEQMAYYKTFPSMEAFNQWYNRAKKAYDEAHPKETIGPDGSIVLG